MGRDVAGVTRVVVVGGGFAGLAVARALAGRRGFSVTLVDRRNHHLFQPLLYQVATAALSPAEIASPIRTVLRGRRRTTVVLAEVTGVDLAGRRIRTTRGQLPYDRLVLACGNRHGYFGHDEWEEHAPGLKSLEEATEIRRRVLTAYEQAEVEDDPARKRALTTFVIVGGGPTGVELAGALGEISRHTLGRDFAHIDPRRTRVILIEAGPRILAGFDEGLAERATRDLERIGVTVWTGGRVTRVSDAGVWLGDEHVAAATVLWAAGVTASPLSRGLGVAVDGQGRAVVETDLSLPGHPEVFVLGDQAHFAHTPDGRPLPGLAPVALQQGRWLAKNLMRERAGAPRRPFRYRDKGQMATIGRSRAILEIGSLKMAGLFAWFAWLVVHIYYLIGFRNRLFVFLSWTWSYLSFARGARLIVDRRWRLTAPDRSATAAPETAPPPDTAAGLSHK